MMILRLCFCCFGSNRDSSNDAKRLLLGSSPANANKRNEFQTVLPRNISHDDNSAYNNYEAIPPIDKGNKSTQFIRPLTSPENETVSDLEKSIAGSSRGSPVVKKCGDWGKLLMKTKRETTKSVLSVLPTITVADSSNSKMNSSENIINAGCNTLPKGNSENTTNIGSNALAERGTCSKSSLSNLQISSNWLKSQSMWNVAGTSNNKSGYNVKSMDTRLSKSMEAVNKAWKSMENIVNDNGFIDLPYGVIYFLASYNGSSKKLSIEIEKIEGLAPKGMDHSKYNCIVKLTMLPHEKHTKYSQIIPAQATLDLKECFLFSTNHPLKKVLRISVYDAELRGKHDAVGHALFYVEDTVNYEQKHHALKLYKQSMPDVQAGSIKIVLKYNQDTEVLNLFIDEAYNLPIISGKCRSHLKLTQHHFGKKVKEIYSPHVNGTQRVRYHFTADFLIDSNRIQNSYIIVRVKIQGFFKKNILIGQVILGPFLYAEYGKCLTPFGRAIIKRETVSHTFRMYL